MGIISIFFETRPPHSSAGIRVSMTGVTKDGRNVYWEGKMEYDACEHILNGLGSEGGELWKGGLAFNSLKSVPTYSIDFYHIHEWTKSSEAVNTLARSCKGVRRFQWESRTIFGTARTCSEFPFESFLICVQNTCSNHFFVNVFEHTEKFRKVEYMTILK